MANRKYVAFDLETVALLPGGGDWRNARPLGIGCAAAVAGDWMEPLVWHGLDPDRTDRIAERMTRDEAQSMLHDLESLVEAGFTIVTWNGLGFDFDVLAEETGMWDVCRRLAMGHVDMMLHIFCERNFRMALATACNAMGTGGKTEGMDGEKAVRMWHDGERQAVMDYCAQDVRATLDLAVACETAGSFDWSSRRGNPNSLRLPDGWLRVAEALLLPEPDTSWMTDPLPRSSLSGWLDEVRADG